MMIMMLVKVSVILCLFSAVRAEKVPVLIWSQSRPLGDLPQVYAGNSIDTDTFSQKYLSPLTTKQGHNVVAFIQDRLHMEDFTKYADVYNPFSDGGAFKNIKGLMDEHFSINLPAVHSPKSAIDSLMKEFSGNVYEVSDPEHVAGLKMEKNKSYLILVHLPATSQENNEEKAIMKNDEKVGEIVKAFNKRNMAFTAIFTGERSKREAHSEYKGRHLLATADNITGIFVNVSGQVFFYSRAIQVLVMNADKTEVSETIELPTNGSLFSNNTSWNNDTVFFELGTEHAVSNVSSTLLTYNVTFYFTVTMYADRWRAENFTLSVTNISNGDSAVVTDEVLSLKDSEMELPPFFSYHCSNLDLYTENRTYILRFDGIQFQPFGIQNDQFSEAWDCVGFFTTPIWMGLFPVGIFTVILFFGMYMITQLSTMDRFDDPKGKTITVNVNE